MWTDIQDYVANLWADHRVRAAVIAVSSIAVAYIGEFIFRRTLMVMVSKTKTDLDDKIVAAMRRPIVLTDFVLLVWITNPADRDRIQSELNTRIYKALGAADIEIPYSKHDVYIKQMPGKADDPANENG